MLRIFHNLFKRRAFDLRSVKDVDDDVIRKFFGSSNENLRKVPLLVAQHVQNELEAELVTKRSIDARRLSEIAGGLQALHRFSMLLHEGVAGWLEDEKRKKWRGDRA